MQFEISKEVDNVYVNSEAGGLDEVASEMREDLQQIEDAADELGVSPSELLNDYDELSDMVKNADETYNEYVDKYREVVDTAGWLPDFSR